MGGPLQRHSRALAATTLDDLDLHLALYVCYELHYRGWDGVDPALEWDPGLLAMRAALEAQFLRLLYAEVGAPRPIEPARAPELLQQAIASSQAPSLSTWVETNAGVEHLRELAVHRSAYQLKEADPHTWAIPRLPAGVAKSALLTLQFDEYGNGAPGESHAELFARTMESLGLDASYGRYVPHLPGVTLATVNLLSMFGLHRRWVGACIGHFAVFEMTSVVPMTRYGAAHRRVAGGNGAEFYDVHVAADASHQLIAIEDLVPAFVRDDPHAAASVLFGARSLLVLEGAFARRVLHSWRSGRSSLRRRLPLAGIGTASRVPLSNAS